MVDVSAKSDTVRTATAFSQVGMQPEVYEQIQQGKIAKGDVLAVAQVAGIMAAKKTADIIPMCHPLPLSGIDVHFGHVFKDGQAFVTIEVQVKTTGKTGVEMEALTAASIVGLTIYDMCKALDKSMELGPTYLLQKTGGKSGDFNKGES